MSPAASSRTLMPHLVLVELLERVGDGTQRARHVGLEDDPQLLGLAGLDLAVQVLERGPTAAFATLGGDLRPCAARPSSRAAFSSATTRRMSPASGTSDRPRTTTALAGPACLTRLPRSFSSARTRPNVSPTTMMSPTLERAGLDERRRDRRRGSCRSGPRRSCRSPSRSGLALSSWRSATSRTISMSSSRPWPALGRHRARAARRRRTPR